MLSHIIDCFTSLEHLLYFANAHGLQDDPYVQFRIQYLRTLGEASALQMKCHWCERVFCTRQELELHELQHSTIADFDLSLFDYLPPTTVEMSTQKTERLVGRKRNHADIDARCTVQEVDGSPHKKREVDDDHRVISTDQLGTGINVPSTYMFRKKRERTFAKNGAIDTSFEVKFTDQFQNKKLSEIHDDLHKLFDDVLNEVRQGALGNSLGRVIIEHKGLSNPIVVPLRELDKIDGSTVMDEITKVLQSNEELSVYDCCTITVGRIDIPSARGRKLPITVLSGENNSLHRKQSIISMPSDNLCMPMAIAVCFMKLCTLLSPDEWKTLTKDDQGSMIDKVLKHKSTPKWYYKHVVDKSRPECTAFAKRLCELVGLSCQRACNIRDIELFETLLDLQILVISSKLGNKFIRVGDNHPDKKKIFLYLMEDCNHFAAIVSITGFFSRPYFCHTCLKPYTDRDKHSCEKTCSVCCTSDCILTDNPMTCRSCNRTCRSMECFQRHGERKRMRKMLILSECEKRYQCRTCRKVLVRSTRPQDLHECGEWKCPCCQEYHKDEHLCYQRAIDDKVTDRKVIFFDCETTQETLLQCESGYQPSWPTGCGTCTEDGGKCKQCTLCKNCNKSWCGSKEHKVNFICMQTACNHCSDKSISDESKCFHCGIRCALCNKQEKNEFKKDPCPDTCGFREKLFRGHQATDSFCRVVFTEQYKNGVVISHNGSGYDYYFIIEWLISNSIRPETIFNGSKILYMFVKKGLNIRVLDSLNYLHMKLSKIPKAFGLKELKKGYLPHFFNTIDHQDYVGPYPEQYYGCDYMNAEDRADFLSWYETKRHAVFDFEKEMREYCRSDVTILREGILKFRELVLEVTGMAKEKTNPRTGKIERIQQQGVDALNYVTIASLTMGIFKSKFLREEFDIEITTLTSDHVEWKHMKYTENGFDVWHDDCWVSSEAYLATHTDHRFGNKKFVRSPIAHVPSEGYTKRYNYSKSSIIWLNWIMKKENIFIQHALNSGEYSIPGTRLIM